jgi:hypothetical protein
MRLSQNFGFWESNLRFSGKSEPLAAFSKAILKTNRVLGMALMIFIFCFASCAGFKKGIADSFTMQGMIYDRSGAAVGNADVFIDEKYVATSDFNGRFYINYFRAGVHSIKVSRESYEEFLADITVLSSVDVLYISMVSRDDLCQMTETALREKEWGQADAFAVRLLQVAPQDPVVRFLIATVYAIPLRSDRKIKESIDILEKLLVDGFTEPVVYLFLADLYEYDIKDNDKALAYLEEYRKLKEDNTQIERYEHLLLQINQR